MKGRNHQITKLNCIHRVLCCLNNLKLKDLKSQVGSFHLLLHVSQLVCHLQHLLDSSLLKAISQKPLKKEPPFRPLTRIISLAPVYSCISHTASNSMHPGHVTWGNTDSYIRRGSNEDHQ